MKNVYCSSVIISNFTPNIFHLNSAVVFFIITSPSIQFNSILLVKFDSMQLNLYRLSICDLEFGISSSVFYNGRERE